MHVALACAVKTLLILIYSYRWPSTCRFSCGGNYSNLCHPFFPNDFDCGGILLHLQKCYYQKSLTRDILSVHGRMLKILNQQFICEWLFCWITNPVKRTKKYAVHNVITTTKNKLSNTTIATEREFLNNQQGGSRSPVDIIITVRNYLCVGCVYLRYIALLYWNPSKWYFWYTVHY